MPVRKTTGKNTTQKVMTATRIGIATSWVPSMAACIRDLPISRCLTVFSSTTMDWSRIMPTARASPPRVMLLIELPRANSPMNAARNDSGSATTATMVARTLRRKTSTTSPASTAPSNASSCSDLMLDRTYVDWSMTTLSTRSWFLGSSSRSRCRIWSSWSLISSTMAIVLAPG